MISEKAVEAAALAWISEFEPRDDPSRVPPTETERRAIRAALSAALPLLLEGKREEIAREVDPQAFEYATSRRHYATSNMNIADPWCAMLFVGESLLLRVQAALDRADRIIAMLGGGE